MKLSGFQYYWLIAIGLIVGLILSALVIIFHETMKVTPAPEVAILILFIYPMICELVVLLEIWSRYKMKAVVTLSLLILAGILIHPFFLLLLYFVPIVYWFSRINGIQDVAVKDT